MKREQTFTFCHGHRKRGWGAKNYLWILKISAKNIVYLVSSAGKKQI